MSILVRIANIPEQISRASVYDINIYIGAIVLMVLFYLAGKYGRPWYGVVLGIIAFMLFQMYAWC